MTLSLAHTLSHTHILHMHNSRIWSTIISHFDIALFHKSSLNLVYVCITLILTLISESFWRMFVSLNYKKFNSRKIFHSTATHEWNKCVCANRIRCWVGRDSVLKWIVSHFAPFLFIFTLTLNLFLFSSNISNEFINKSSFYLHIDPVECMVIF